MKRVFEEGVKGKHVLQGIIIFLPLRSCKDVFVFLSAKFTTKSQEDVQKRRYCD
jgi:hypothetical protein